jgi:hypothetical protein
MTLDEAIKMYTNNAEYERTHGSLQGCLDFRQLAEWLKTRWIPVSEKLPEDGTYLICTDDGYIATIMYDRPIGWLLDANIIAYMPLPQPYKGESEDTK